jgi:transposase
LPRPGSGRPRSRPDRVLADKGYSYRTYRRYLRRRKIACVSPEREDARRWRAHKPGRPPAFDPAAHRRRNVVERRVARLKHLRGLATRYEKTADALRGLLVFATILLWTS